MPLATKPLHCGCRPNKIFWMILTYRYRLKDATAGKYFDCLSRAVNVVWNFCGETQEAARRQEKRWPSGFDLIKLTSGSSQMLGLHSDTIQAVCKQFAISRDAAKRRPHWRGKRSLGWIPFQAARAIKIDGDTVIYLKRRYRFWNSRPIDGTIKAGCFAQDARKRWRLCLQVEIAEQQDCGTGEVGIDLGLSSLATLSDGSKIKHPRYFKRYEDALARAQRAGDKKRARAIHAKIGNARRHYLHVQSTKIVRENATIVIGNVIATSLPYRAQRKSALDASWSEFRSMLRYKASRHGARYIETEETYSSVTCSACGARSGPQGQKGLRVRAWVCGCGASHDRDVNSAINLLLGAERRPPVVEIPVL